MKNTLLLITFWALTQSLFAQLTIRVTSIPANTPANAKIYAVGTFNNWNPADATKVLTKGSDGVYSIVLNPPTGQMKFKFTRGDWATVEGNANGTFLPDRVFTYNGQAATLNLTIQSWEDLGGVTGGTGSTAAANVKILSNNFYIPDLNRNRRIWIYLPPDYETALGKRYPVLYMHDAQNLFDVKTTAFGTEWKVDESLNSLFQQGDYGCIVIGIDNSASRLDEYSPWVNPQYGGGQGDEYSMFLVNTLKPYVDANYRTISARHATGVMGSSMGGLISMFAFSEYQDVFSKAGVFSPAFWFAGDNSATHTATHPRKGSGRVYFLAGGQEPASVTSNMQKVADAMLTAGFSTSEILFETVSDGQHSEWFWAREFPDAYKWLFRDASTSVSNGNGKKPKLEIFPNPAGDWVRYSGVEAGEKVQVQIVNTTGKVLRDTIFAYGEPLWTGDLAPGVYVVRIRKIGGSWQKAKLVRGG
jgi:predicted alpha/beta superfamily hydrolase